jgi:hypothetical protein
MPATNPPKQVSISSSSICLTMRSFPGVAVVTTQLGSPILVPPTLRNAAASSRHLRAVANPLSSRGVERRTGWLGIQDSNRRIRRRATELRLRDNLACGRRKPGGEDPSRSSCNERDLQVGPRSRGCGLPGCAVPAAWKKSGKPRGRCEPGSNGKVRHINCVEDATLGGNSRLAILR